MGHQCHFVEVKILIPAGLEMPIVQAQAERERQARDSRGFREQVAESLGKRRRPTSTIPLRCHLRAMNMLYEGLKQNSTIVIVRARPWTRCSSAANRTTRLLWDWVKNAQTKARKARSRVRGRNLVLRSRRWIIGQPTPMRSEGKDGGAPRADAYFQEVSL